VNFVSKQTLTSDKTAGMERNALEPEAALLCFVTPKRKQTQMLRGGKSTTLIACRN
jgi:hypothetical protein